MRLANSVLFGLVLLSTLTHAQVTSAVFPGSRTHLLSPDKHFELINVDNDKEPYHSVSLKDRKTGERRRVYQYERSAAVLWAPDSKHFAVNDHAGSDFTNTYIIAIDQDAPRVDVQEQIRQLVDDLGGGDHEYYGVSRWLDSRTVVVRHWGHGERRSFCDCVIYVVNKSARKCTRHPAGRDPEESCDTATP